MKDIELPPLPRKYYLVGGERKAWDESDMHDYARAAIEANGAQRVPDIDYEALIQAGWKNHKYAQGTRGCVAFKHGAEWFRSVLLASTSAPAQQECKRLTGEQASAMAAYFNVPADYVHTVYNRVHGIKE